MLAGIYFRQHDGEILQSPLILISSGMLFLDESELGRRRELIRARQVGHQTHCAAHELVTLVRHRVQRLFNEKNGGN